MSFNEPKPSLILPGDTSTDARQGAQGASKPNDFAYKVKFVVPVSFKVVDFISKEGNAQGPKKLVAFMPDGSAYVVVSDLAALETLSEEETNAIHEWQTMLEEKAKLLGGNLVIDPTTGEIRGGQMPPSVLSAINRQPPGNKR